MNNIDKRYQELLQDILDNGIEKKDRTNTGTISIFGRQIRHKMSDGFPLLTSKKMFFKGIVTELLWFLRGDTNIKFLIDNGCHIWDGDAYKVYDKDFDTEHPPFSGPFPSRLTHKEFEEKILNDTQFEKMYGDLGPIYGKQWRSWIMYENGITLYPNGAMSDPQKTKLVRQIDQIQNLINDLKTNPDSRRLMVNAWNVGELDQMVLPPCHFSFQCYSHEKEDKRYLSLAWNQRSVDVGLGLPFNIASYALLLEMIANEVNMIPYELIGNLGDCHIYNNHIEGLKEQLTREPYPLPTVHVRDGLFSYIPDDIILDNYKSHPPIKLPLSN
jgi:thymidylate synthase